MSSGTTANARPANAALGQNETLEPGEARATIRVDGMGMES